MADKKQGSAHGYIGRIANTGTQVVEAPHQKVSKKTGTVRTGKDMRTGSKR